jgi:hypothetical protein
MDFIQFALPCAVEAHFFIIVFIATVKSDSCYNFPLQYIRMQKFFSPKKGTEM